MKKYDSVIRTGKTYEFSNGDRCLHGVVYTVIDTKYDEKDRLKIKLNTLEEHWLLAKNFDIVRTTASEPKTVPVDSVPRIKKKRKVIDPQQEVEKYYETPDKQQLLLIVHKKK